MINMIQLVLPVPISTNTYYRNFNGRMIISRAGRHYSTQVRNAALEQLGCYQPVQGRLALDISFYPPDKRVRDLDNFCGKALLDALCKAGLYEDDSQIDVLNAQRKEVVKGGMVSVKIEVIK
jgi:crossover junction endodeoxyribonuclease RusA